MLETGDIIFEAGNAWFSRVIRKVTGGRVNHVKIVYDATQVFETDGSLGRAMFRPIVFKPENAYVVVRPKFMSPDHKFVLQRLCRQYEGIPYDYLDIALNLVFSPLSDNLRKRLITFFGTKHLMKCDELVLRLLYEVSLRKEFKWYEGNTPSSLLALILQYPELFDVTDWGLSAGDSTDVSRLKDGIF